MQVFPTTYDLVRFKRLAAGMKPGLFIVLLCPFYHTTKRKSARPTAVTFEAICSHNRTGASVP
jgi:hypothetical protein